jgi:pimeloyl-ACP methyl ester carboxylesterase
MRALDGLAAANPASPVDPAAASFDPAAAAGAPGDELVLSARDGVPLFCRQGGEGDITLLFVHGWSCNQDFFAPQIAAATQHYRTLALDLAGHGRSGPRSLHRVEAFADDVAILAARSEGPLILVVHSAGGRVACAAARRLGARLRGIIGFDCFQNLALPTPDPALVETRIAALEADFRSEVEGLVALFFRGVDSPVVKSWVSNQMTSTDPAQAIAAFRAFSLFDAAAAVNGLSVPVRAFNSNGVLTDVDRIREIIPRFEATILEGKGHFLHLVAPQALNRMMLQAVEDIVG